MVRQPRKPRPHERVVKTRAWGYPEMIIDSEAMEPIDGELDGVPFVISFGFGTELHAVSDPGSGFFSDTGFRSFSSFRPRETPEQTIADFTEVLDAWYREPVGRDLGTCGLGGNLKPWWPLGIGQLRRDVEFMNEHCGQDKSRYAQYSRQLDTRVQQCEQFDINPNTVLYGIPDAPHYIRDKNGVWVREEAKLPPEQLSLF